MKEVFSGPNSPGETREKYWAMHKSMGIGIFLGSLTMLLYEVTKTQLACQAVLGVLSPELWLLLTFCGLFFLCLHDVAPKIKLLKRAAASTIKISSDIGSLFIGAIISALCVASLVESGISGLFGNSPWIIGGGAIFYALAAVTNYLPYAMLTTEYGREEMEKNRKAYPFRALMLLPIIMIILYFLRLPSLQLCNHFN
ncbi:hypothetical protein [Salinicola avicenniae]|uniref:hypothetical protein n=1 Tax=Salinicola avicenniae TaxID=2916836 RepID=UPI0020745D1B|nr:MULTISPECIES: hypothetical protein [unclassified Salinicola]